MGGKKPAQRRDTVCSASVVRSGHGRTLPESPGRGPSTSCERPRHTPGMRLELTRQGDYGIRAMVALAGQTGTDWLSVPKMSSEMAIPERVLPKVMAGLVRAGLVEGRIGRTGGYRLARAAASITLLDVIAALEPEPDMPACVLRGGPCGLDGRCAVHDAFRGAREAMLQRLDTVSLDDIVRLGPSI